MTAIGRPLLALRSVGMTFDGSDGPNPVLADVSLDVGEHDFVAVVGESGCGKTTLLRIMAGLQRPSTGEVLLEGRPLDGPGPQVCLVFQHYASTLLPWKNALDNVLFGLPGRRSEAARWREAAHALLDRIGLGGSTRRHPWELSGGMQQRVVLARALVRRPRALLLDEPFSALDEGTRESLQELLCSIHRDEGCSIVLVTHRLEEAILLSRRVAVLGGRPARVETVLDSSPGLSREALRAHLPAPAAPERTNAEDRS